MHHSYVCMYRVLLECHCVSTVKYISELYVYTLLSVCVGERESIYPVLSRRKSCQITLTVLVFSRGLNLGMSLY